MVLEAWYSSTGSTIKSPMNAHCHKSVQPPLHYLLVVPPLLQICSLCRESGTNHPSQYSKTSLAGHLQISIFLFGSQTMTHTILLQRYSNSLNGPSPKMDYLKPVPWLVNVDRFHCSPIKAPNCLHPVEPTFSTGRAGRIGRAQVPVRKVGNSNPSRVKQMTYKIDSSLGPMRGQGPVITISGKCDCGISGHGVNSSMVFHWGITTKSPCVCTVTSQYLT